MINIEKLIKSWEIFRDSNPYQICDGKEFRAIKEPEYCMGQMIEDTLTMLKKQEAINPKISETATYHNGITSFRRIYSCGSCNKRINSDASFCQSCGRAVKWE